MYSRMPVPVWDSFVYEPLDSATVVSDDIWKKFDLDDLASYQHSSDFMEDPITTVSSPLPQQYCEVPMMMNFDRLNCQASSEIRHHDCMWAGLCISKEHNRAHPAKKDMKIARRIPAGRSLLIPKNLQQQQQQQQQQTSLLQQQQQHSSSSLSLGLDQSSSSNFGCRSSASALTSTKNLESDGDSTRPDTPQSSAESETESEEDEDEEEEEEDEEDEVPLFKHEQISINDIVPVSEATGQHIQKRTALYDRRKEEETVIRNTLMSDHCYHLNQHQPSSKKLTEHLGVQTPSDSEEEIDVVSWDKPTRPVNTATGLSLPTYPSPAEHQRLQHTVNTALKDRHSGSKLNAQNAAHQAALAASTTSMSPAPTPRPRGRPPSNSTIASRKRAAAAAALEQAKATAVASGNKRAKHSGPRSYNRRQAGNSIAGSSGNCSSSSSSGVSSGSNSSRSSPQSSPSKNMNNCSRNNSSSDDEPDTEKRSLHNNMERQRRIELRNAFEDLRVLVPEVEAKEKAPKVAILRQAASYCDRLTDQEHLNLSKIADLRRKQDRLKAQLGYLRRSLAMMR